ncbi:hypothetical protein B0T17DRAFT_613274 [Bombardia bombarda]|uniref:Uncharacterized protein n=1 Tax=Bombardia bombarda TaxID=252184 RepID=A0AA39XM35_9PEZI|nr:hypothetical protein B0T17DRAFT_613274 [Bombardia bombarda]
MQFSTIFTLAFAAMTSATSVAATADTSIATPEETPTILETLPAVVETRSNTIQKRGCFSGRESWSSDYNLTLAYADSVCNGGGGHSLYAAGQTKNWCSNP